MSNPICPMYHKDYESDGHAALKARHPTPAMHVGPNYLYCQTAQSLGIAEEYVDAATTFVDAEGVTITGDAMAWAIAQYLTQDVRLPLYAPLSVWQKLSKHPTYRLYSGKYQEGEEDLFQSDIAYTSGMIEAAGMADALTQWKAATANATYETIPDIMFNLIRSFAEY